MGVNHRLSQAPQQGRGASMILLLLLLPFCQAVPKPHPTSPALVGSEGNEAVADDYSDQQPHEWAHPSLVGSENHLNRQLPNPPIGFRYPSSNLDQEDALASDYSDYIGTDNNMDYHFHFPHTRPRPNGGGGRLNRGNDYQTDNNMDYHFHFPHTRPRPRPNGGGGRLNRGCNSCSVATITRRTTGTTNSGPVAFSAAPSPALVPVVLVVPGVPGYPGYPGYPGS